LNQRSEVLNYRDKPATESLMPHGGTTPMQLEARWLVEACAFGERGRAGTGACPHDGFRVRTDLHWVQRA
jgi:hypothetical protein